MTDRTTEVLRRTMQAIVDVAPEAPDVAKGRTAPRQTGRNPVLVAAVAFVLVLLVGAAMALLTGPATPPVDVADQPPPPPTVTTLPPTTVPATTAVASEVLYDTAAATTWGDLVEEYLVFVGWDEPVIASFETRLTPFADGGTVTALVGETDWSRLIVDLQGWADGEYRADPAWQREVAGSNDPGRETPDGTLFVRTGYANVVVLVNEHGLLTLQMVREDDQTDRMEALATALAGAMEALATGR